MRSPLLARAPFNEELDTFTDSSRPTGTVVETVRRLGAALSNVSPLTTQKLLLCGVGLRAGVPITSISWYSGNTPAGTPTNQWVCLMDGSRNLVRQSTDALATAWGALAKKTFALDSLPITAVALVSGTVYRYTFAGSGSSLANGDSVVISNCSPVGYNGTFTVSNVQATTFDADIGANPAAFVAGTGTVQMAASKRTITLAASGLYYLGLMVKATTVNTMMGVSSSTLVTGEAPILVGQTADVSLVGVCPSPAGAITAGANIPYGLVT